MRQIFLVLFLFFQLLSFSQADVQLSTKKTDFDTTRIQDLSDQLSIYNYGISKLYAIELTSKSGKKFKLSPNGRTNFGFGFNYKWMGIGIAFKLPGSENDDDIYGETSRLDFQLNVFTHKLGVDFSTQYYKGYYMANPEKFTEWKQPEYPQLNDLKTVSINLSAFYFTNHKKFSYRAAFVRNEIQKKSAGSLILGAYTRYDVANSPEGLIPKELPSELKDTFDIFTFKSINYGLTAGYAYTFVIKKKFFASLSIAPGLGSKTLVINTNSGKSDALNGLSARFETRMALGYEHKYFYLGLAAISSLTSFEYKGVTVSTTTNKFRFFIGKRFDLEKRKKRRAEKKATQS